MNIRFYYSNGNYWERPGIGRSLEIIFRNVRLVIDMINRFRMTRKIISLSKLSHFILLALKNVFANTVTRPAKSVYISALIVTLLRIVTGTLPLPL